MRFFQKTISVFKQKREDQCLHQSFKDCPLLDKKYQCRSGINLHRLKNTVVEQHFQTGLELCWRSTVRLLNMNLIYFPLSFEHIHKSFVSFYTNNVENRHFEMSETKVLVFLIKQLLVFISVQCSHTFRKKILPLYFMIILDAVKKHRFGPGAQHSFLPTLFAQHVLHKRQQTQLSLSLLVLVWEKLII